MTDVLSQHELESIDAYRRAANYLSVGQIYLEDNPLLKESLREKYHAHYEVLPYYVLIEEEHGSRKDKTRNRIQSGFDVDVYGVSDKDAMELPPPIDYSVGYTELKKIADTVSHTSDSFVEVILPSAAVIDTSKRFRAEAKIRIRISHAGDVYQPAGLPERQTLEEIEKQPQSLGITRR